MFMPYLGRRKLSRMLSQGKRLRGINGEELPYLHCKAKSNKGSSDEIGEETRQNLTSADTTNRFFETFS
ncbi:CLUMA_CG003059, isoform A [Clunio marinus]|uniref:CLUMA_CG003059, isoform A n=1 Tax=Clunio marinus TaxID=568069 RepID=A0A1J1HPI3_9DIPT|nr:CLUMA_CG003059, isoform A [Clunio marinus]